MKLKPNWAAVIGDAMTSPQMSAVQKFLQVEKGAGKTIYPKEDEIFAAFDNTDFKDIKVVILGQDPYHGPDQAHGLSFSVKQGIKLPPSLKNIFKEIEQEYGHAMPKTGDLTPWAKQGVLLLNATLTVEAANAGSHQKRGWEEFTDAVIQAINKNLDHVVFILWGSYAQKKGQFIDRAKHLVLEAPHPSPLSAHRGFLGCGHFKKANDYLVSQGKEPIIWDKL